MHTSCETMMHGRVLFGIEHRPTGLIHSQPIIFACILPIDILSKGDHNGANTLGCVLAPTRELCCQIFDDARKVCLRAWNPPPNNSVGRIFAMMSCARSAAPCPQPVYRAWCVFWCSVGLIKPVSPTVPPGNASLACGLTTECRTKGKPDQVHGYPQPYDRMLHTLDSCPRRILLGTVLYGDRQRNNISLLVAQHSASRAIGCTLKKYACVRMEQSVAICAVTAHTYGYLLPRLRSLCIHPNSSA